MGERWSLQAKTEDENAGFANLEPGRYLLGIESKEDSLTQSKQYPLATLKCVALEGPAKGSLTHRVTCTPQGEPGHGFTLHFLHAVGLPYGGENPDEVVTVEFDSDEFIGRQFWADVEIETYAKKGEDKSDESTWTGKSSKAVKIYTPEEIAAEQGGGEGSAAAPSDGANADAEDAAAAEAAATAAAEAEATASAEAEAEAAAEAARAATAAAKPPLKKPLVKPPLKPAAAPVKAAPAKAAGFARR